MSEILKLIEKIHEKFPQIPVVKMLKVWFKKRDIPFSVSKESNDTETVIDFCNTNLTDVSTEEIINFIFKKFPETPIMDMFILMSKVKHGKI